MTRPTSLARQTRLARVIILNILTRVTMMARLTILSWLTRMERMNITPVRTNRKRGERAGRSK